MMVYLKKIFKISTSVITLIAVFFLAKIFLQQNLLDLFYSLKSSHLTPILQAFFLYLIVLFTTLLCWKLSLEFVGEKKLSFKNTMNVFSKSNISKYIPGSVFEFVVKAVLVKKLGWKNSDVVLSALLEAALGVFSGVLYLGIVVFFYKESFVQHIQLLNSVQIKWYGEMFFLALFSGLVLLYFFRKRFLSYFKIRSVSSFLKLSGIFVFLQFVIYSIHTLILVCLMHGVFGNETTFSQVVLIHGSFLFSNFLGYVSLGSPGGLGVREGLFYLLLKGSFDGGVVLALSLLQRAIYIVGDFFIYGLVSILKLK